MFIILYERNAGGGTQVQISKMTQPALHGDVSVCCDWNTSL